MVEHIHHHDVDDSSSASSFIVALLAILLIVAMGLFALRSLGIGMPTSAQTDNGDNVQLDINVPANSVDSAPSVD